MTVKSQMRSVHLRVSTDVSEQLRSQSLTLDISLGDVVTRLLEAPRTTVLPSDEGTPPSPMDLNTAVSTLLQYLPKEYGEQLIDQTRETGIPPAAYLLSQLKLVRERGEASFVEGEFIEALPSRHIPVELPKSVPCEYCGQPFEPARRGQRFCPQPTDGTESCGRKASLAQIHATRPPTAYPGSEQFGPRQLSQTQMDMMMAAKQRVS